MNELKAIRRINESRNWLFENINKIDSALIQLTNRKRERTQISRLKNKYGNIFTNEFLNSSKLQKLKQEEISNLNRPIANEEIEIVIKRLPTKESKLLDS